MKTLINRILNPQMFLKKSGQDLGVTRILMFSVLLYFMWDIKDFTHLIGSDRTVFLPHCLSEALCLPVLRGDDLRYHARLFCLMAILGLLTPLAIAGTTLILSSLITANMAAGLGNHAYYPLVAFFLSLLFSRCGDHYSVDAFIRRRFDLRPADRNQPLHGITLRFMQFYLILIFFLSGLAKLRAAGLDWIFSDNLKNILAWSQLLSPDKKTPLSEYVIVTVVQYPYIGQLLALSTILLEITAPLLFILIPKKWILPTLLFGFQIINSLILKINFQPWIILYLCWIPWSDILNRLRPKI